MKMESAFIYTNAFSGFDYGPAHPFKIVRLKLCYELLKSFHIFEQKKCRLIEPSPAKKEDLLTFHQERYIEVLMKINNNPDYEEAIHYGIGSGDNPPFRGVYDWSLLYTGASLKATQMVLSGEVSIAFNIAGGLHHAMPSRASGFCYINDPAVIIHKMLQRGKRIAYIDIDAHHGDGVQYAFYNTNKVLTISFHESGEFLFPGTGFVEEIGEGEGRGYSVNVPLYPGTGDKTYLWAFERIVPPLIEAYKPDIIVTQLGVDTMIRDPLAHLMLTTYSFTRIIKTFKSFKIPWIALGGGGYDIPSVARCWALAFILMCDKPFPERIPPHILPLFKQYGYEDDTLLDSIEPIPEDQNIKKWVEDKIKYIENHVFPVHGLGK